MPFSDKRADMLTLDVMNWVADIRAKDINIKSEEIAYAFFQTLAVMEEGPSYWDFLHEALNECINQEVSSNDCA